MVFAPGVLAGYFSGGCVEGDVAGTPGPASTTGSRGPGLWRGQPWPDIRLLCGARSKSS